MQDCDEDDLIALDPEALRRAHRRQAHRRGPGRLRGLMARQNTGQISDGLPVQEIPAVPQGGLQFDELLSTGPGIRAVILRSPSIHAVHRHRPRLLVRQPFSGGSVTRGSGCSAFRLFHCRSGCSRPGRTGREPRRIPCQSEEARHAFHRASSCRPQSMPE